MKIYKNSTINSAIKAINKHKKRTLVVLDKKNKLLGTLSDGNIRKSILKGFVLKSSIDKIYDKNPITLFENQATFQNLKKIFLKHKIQLIPIINKKKILKKIFYLEDILEKNIFNKVNYNKFSNLGVVIMAGGKGVRMKPYTNIFPKPLLPLQNDTVIDAIISKFLENKINNFYITTNYKYNFIRDHLNKYKSEINFNLINEKKPLGTAGSLSYLKSLKENLFFVTNSDVIINEDYKKIIDFHKKNKNDLTIIAAERKINLSYGVCFLDSKKKFSGILEKPSYNYLLNTGMYLINSNNFSIIKKNQKLDMNDLINKLKKRNHKIGVYEIDEFRWKDFGNWKKYNQNLDNY